MSLDPPPPEGKGPYSPFNGHRRLIHLQWPLITQVIETPNTSRRRCHLSRPTTPYHSLGHLVFYRVSKGP